MITFRVHFVRFGVHQHIDILATTPADAIRKIAGYTPSAARIMVELTAA